MGKDGSGQLAFHLYVLALPIRFLKRIQGLNVLESRLLQGTSGHLHDRVHGDCGLEKISRWDKDVLILPGLYIMGALYVNCSRLFVGGFFWPSLCVHTISEESSVVDGGGGQHSNAMAGFRSTFRVKKTTPNLVTENYMTQLMLRRY